MEKQSAILVQQLTSDLSRTGAKLLETWTEEQLKPMKPKVALLAVAAVSATIGASLVLKGTIRLAVRALNVDEDVGCVLVGAGFLALGAFVVSKTSKKDSKLAPGLEGVI